MGSQFTSLKVTSQPAGSGVFADPTEAAHFVSLAYLQALLAPLSGANHAAVTVVDSLSMDLTLVSGTQELRADVRRKTSSLAVGEGLLAETTAGLVVVLGTGANQAAKGTDVLQLQTDVAGKAATVHSHVITDVTGLQAALDGKSDTGHSHVIADVAGLQSELDDKAAVDHTHTIGDVSGLADALAGKMDSSGTLEISSVTGLQAALDGKSATGHTHAISEVTDLENQLAGKSDTTHTHDAATQDDPGFLSAADKTKLDLLSTNEHWRESVDTYENLPLNTDPVGTVRLVRDTGVPWRCVTQVGFRVDQWKVTGSTKKAAGYIGNGVDSVIDWIHNLETKDITFSVRDAATDEFWAVSGRSLDENTIRLTFGAAPVSSGGRLVVLG